MTEPELDLLKDRFRAILSTCSDNSATSSGNEPSPQPVTESVPIRLVDAHAHDAHESSDLSSAPTLNEGAREVLSVHLLGENVYSNMFNKAFHISPFNVSVTPDNVINYIAANAEIDKKRLKVHRLTKRGQDVSNLRHVNFKIETDEATSKIISRSSFWPSHVTIKPWTPKDVPNNAREHFLANTLT